MKNFANNKGIGLKQVAFVAILGVFCTVAAGSPQLTEPLTAPPTDPNPPKAKAKQKQSKPSDKAQPSKAAAAEVQNKKSPAESQRSSTSEPNQPASRRDDGPSLVGLDRSHWPTLRITADDGPTTHYGILFRDPADA